jgi:integrase/recombinase XerD
VGARGRQGLRANHCSYSYALARWLDYCLRARIDPLDARRADVDDWVAQLNSRNPETVNARLAAVSSWYGYLVDNDLDVRDPVARVKRPKRRRGGSMTEYLDEDQLNALLCEANRRLTEAEAGGDIKQEIAARDVAVLRILATTAVRSGPVQLATIGDVRAERAGHRVLRYHGKGDGGADDHRYQPLVPYAAAGVDHYLRLRAEREAVPVDQLTGLAFVTTPYQGRPGGRGLRSDALAAMIRDIAAAAGIATAHKLTPHSIRHTVLTLLARVRTLAEVQDFADHADPRTTRTYVHTDQTLNNSPAYNMVAFIHDAPKQT